MSFVDPFARLIGTTHDLEIKRNRHLIYILLFPFCLKRTLSEKKGRFDCV